MIVSITRWSLAHKRLVVLVWLTVTAIGIASAGAATKALSDSTASRDGRAIRPTARSRRHSGPAATTPHSSRW